MAIGSPLRANPGGQLTPDEIVGRATLAARLLDTLELRSIVLTGERRLGKTTLTTLLEAVAGDRGWSVAKLSVEGIETSELLYSRLTREIDGSGRATARTKAKSAAKSVEGASIAGVRLKPASRTLDEAAQELSSG